MLPTLSVEIMDAIGMCTTVLRHTPISISIPNQCPPRLAVSEPKVTRAREIPENTLYSVPACHPGVRRETCHRRHRERNVRACGEHDPVECTNSLAVEHVTHHREFSRIRQGLLKSEPDLGIERGRDGFRILQPISAKDGIDVRALRQMYSPTRPIVFDFANAMMTLDDASFATGAEVSK